MTIGQRIKELRLEKKLSQRELGIKMNVSQQMIGQYEALTTIPKIETIKKICNALEIPISELLGDGFYFSFDENGELEECLYIKSSKDGINDIYHFDSDFLYKNNDIDKLLIEASKEYFPNIEKMDIHERADIYNSLYSCVVYNENNNTVSVYPFLPTELLEPYNKLNSKGKEKAIEQIDMLTKIDEYTKNDENT